MSTIRIAARRPCLTSLPIRTLIPSPPPHRTLSTTPIRPEILGLDRQTYSKPQIPQRTSILTPHPFHPIKTPILILCS